ncbi:MAG: hypothetical protein ABJO97_19865 [Roseibium sp.]|uniref:hypothetical protein n=1 Tax=Roseibium sp. TaxID=1936156 RepID=UPI00329A647F
MGTALIRSVHPLELAVGAGVQRQGDQLRGPVPLEPAVVPGKRHLQDTVLFPDAATLLIRDQGAAAIAVRVVAHDRAVGVQ